MIGISSDDAVVCAPINAIRISRRCYLCDNERYPKTAVRSLKYVSHMMFRGCALSVGMGYH